LKSIDINELNKLKELDPRIREDDGLRSPFLAFLAGEAGQDPPIHDHGFERTNIRKAIFEDTLRF